MSENFRVIERAHDWLVDALEGIDGPALFASPYLSFSVCALIARAARDSAYPFALITCLDPGAVAAGYQSVKGLQELLDAGVDVRHVDRVHAKCFIVGSAAMLGSANLTGAGLGVTADLNRELGITLGAAEHGEARRVIESWPARAVTDTDVRELLLQARSLTDVTAIQSAALDEVTAVQRAEQLLADARDPNRTLWLKLEYGQPALDGWRAPSWFASPKKGRPSFRPGDLVIICAHDTQDCYAVVEVVAEAEHQPLDYLEVNDAEQTERWPWVNRTQPRLVPDDLLPVKLADLAVHGGSLQNGHVRLQLDQFTTAVRSLARLAAI